jgi:hypothetical protein
LRRGAFRERYRRAGAYREGTTMSGGSDGEESWLRSHSSFILWLTVVLVLLYLLTPGLVGGHVEKRRGNTDAVSSFYSLTRWPYENIGFYRKYVDATYEWRRN